MKHGNLYLVGEQEPVRESVTVLLGNPLGPYVDLYTREDYLEQKSLLENLGYHQRTAARAVAYVHNLNPEPTQYFRAMKHHQLAPKYLPSFKNHFHPVIAATILNVDQFREEIDSNYMKHQLKYFRAASDLLLLLADQDPVGSVAIPKD